MRLIGNGWVLLRVLVAAANIYGVVTYPADKSNLDWPACFLITGAFSLAVFWWLYLVSKKAATDWSEPYSFDTPFFPMWRYPVRFWFLASLCLLAAGMVRLLVDVLQHRDHAAFGGTFFFWGLGIFVVLQIQKKLLKPNQ